MEIDPKEAHIYEVSYLLLPSLSDEDAVSKATGLKEILQSASATIVSDENPVLIDLAYPMVKVIQTTRHKCQSGYFAWVKFETSSESLATVKKNLDADVDVLRFMIVKTVKENTLLNGKMMLKKEERAKASTISEGEAVSDDVEEKDAEALSADLDKTIDDLVIA